ncbi:hypothetical protein OAV88_03105, partial [bacterium]|nr:hypothetical protein [bacterium]
KISIIYTPKHVILYFSVSVKFFRFFFNFQSKSSTYFTISYLNHTHTHTHTHTDTTAPKRTFCSSWGSWLACVAYKFWMSQTACQDNKCEM